MNAKLLYRSMHFTTYCSYPNSVFRLCNFVYFHFAQKVSSCPSRTLKYISKYSRNIMSMRQRVLSTFKTLHRVASTTFEGDERTLLAARNKINEEFKKNKHVQNEGSIDELVKMAIEVENELKANVIQAREKEPGVYELNITKDTTKLDNVMFDENAVIEKPRKGSKRCKKEEK